MLDYDTHSHTKFYPSKREKGMENFIFFHEMISANVQIIVSFRDLIEISFLLFTLFDEKRVFGDLSKVNWKHKCYTFGPFIVRYKFWFTTVWKMLILISTQFLTSNVQVWLWYSNFNHICLNAIILNTILVDTSHKIKRRSELLCRWQSPQRNHKHLENWIELSLTATFYSLKSHQSLALNLISKSINFRPPIRRLYFVFLLAIWPATNCTISFNWK